MIALIHPPKADHLDEPKDANAPTGLFFVIRPSDVSATIIVYPKVSARIM